MNELLTEKQKQRRLRDAQVVGYYNTLKAQYPTASPTMVINEMLDKKIGGLTSFCGIRAAILRYTKQATL